MPSFDEPTEPAPPVIYRRRLYVRPYFFSILSSVILISCIGCCLFSRFLMGFGQFDGAAGADKVAARITDWTPPKNFVGKQGVIFDNFAMQFDIALYQHEEGRGMLVIAQFHPKINYSVSDKRLMMQQFVELLAPDLKNLDLSSTESKERVIREKPAKFEIGLGDDRATRTYMRQVTGDFRGKVDDAMLILQGEEAFLDEKQIEEFVQSIQ